MTGQRRAPGPGERPAGGASGEDADVARRGAQGNERRPTRAQFDFLQGFYRTVAAVGSALGSESSDAGIVVPTDADGLQEAIAAITPPSYEVHPLSFGELAGRYGSVRDPGLHGAIERLLDELRPARPSVALVGTARDFHPDESARGMFFLALFVKARTRAGTNLLVLFPRVET